MALIASATLTFRVEETLPIDLESGAVFLGSDEWGRAGRCRSRCGRLAWRMRSFVARIVCGQRRAVLKRHLLKDQRDSGRSYHRNRTHFSGQAAAFESYGLGQFVDCTNLRRMRGEIWPRAQRAPDVERGYPSYGSSSVVYAFWTRKRTTSSIAGSLFRRSQTGGRPRTDKRVSEREPGGVINRSTRSSSRCRSARALAGWWCGSGSPPRSRR